jgi:hypothetical protein
MFWRNAHCLEDTGVEVFDDDAVFEGFARAFVGGDANPCLKLTGSRDS